ncbi:MULTISPECIES: hypothetical protein [Pseudonocardia]|uniref:ATP/GTP-binding protein n=2 Tax=Pseudonocardia TaxID=1847 RepID=A0A1Y2MVU3_PSEAH|nr:MULTISPECIES: hypothetical protein [Pseudonocardia]OSY39313.1 hypothetical protein BG845_03587 [Pseudonocardia autotrophica]TDN76465.1 hypothetical protein C8E95_5671 [Pseudonocardia autotrophica]BBG00462.1 ATP/GTP-binding protein [Pseudonocardia autotrophica]GEC28989.1 ATP/GTP-binding protein [Pseudonocardia saturnea]
MLTAPGLAAILPAVVMVLAADTEPPDCVVIDSIGRCVVAAYDPGRPGGPLDPDRDDESSAEPRSQRSRPSGGADASTQPPRPRIVAKPFGDGGWVQGMPIDPNDLLNGVPVDRLPAPDPVVIGQLLTQRAVEQLTLAPPAVHTSVADTGFIGVPMWLWIDDEGAGPVSATATAGAAQVTAVGRLSAVEWSMGPPGATVRCTGPGTPWTGQDGSSPDCGYVYELRSLPERTAGSGRWTVTATSVWTVTWSGVSGGLPVDGQQTVRVSADTSLAVGEVQVLVDGGGDR